MILDVKKNIFFGILLSLITFLFIFIPGFKVSAASFTSSDQDFLQSKLGTFDCDTIKQIAEDNNIDSTYDSFILSYTPYSTNYSYLTFFNSDDNHKIVDQGSEIDLYGPLAFFSGIKFNPLTYNQFLPNGFNGYAYYKGNNYYIINNDYKGSNSVYLSKNFECNLKSKSYTFDEDLDVTNISKVKVKFDLPSDTKNLNLSLNYSITGMNIFGTIGQPYIALKSINEDGKEQTDISNTDRVDYDTLVANACVIADCDQYKDWKTNPFEEMLDGITEDKVNNFLNSHVTDVSKWDSFREITNKIINRQYNYANHYVDDFKMSLLPDSTVNGYSLEFDTFNYNGSLHLNFTSNLNYTIEYEYMSENEDYFTTINMKDYAALIMIPKVYDRNNEIQSSISSDIYLSGKYDIELWESLESKNVLYRKSNYEDIVFSHYQHRLYPNAVLYFIKKPVDNSTMDLYIKFDSRYYSYVTKTNLAEEVVINNPNTGEDVTIGDISNLFDSNLENDDFSILDYLDDIRDTADYFDYYFNKGWKLLPFRIRAIILFIFNIMCVAIVLKIGGYKK